MYLLWKSEYDLKEKKKNEKWSLIIIDVLVDWNVSVNVSVCLFTFLQVNRELAYFLSPILTALLQLDRKLQQYERD